MKQIFAFFILMFCLVLATNAQDKIIQTNGEIIKCKILEVGTSEIKYLPFDNLDGPTYSIVR